MYKSKYKKAHSVTSFTVKIPTGFVKLRLTALQLSQSVSPATHYRLGLSDTSELIRETSILGFATLSAVTVVRRTVIKTLGKPKRGGFTVR